MRRPARLAPAFEHLDDDHAAATAWAWRPEVVRFVRCVVIGRRGDIQEFASKCEAGLAGGAGEQPVVPDAMEAAWQDMEEEAADELITGMRVYHPTAFTIMQNATDPAALTDKEVLFLVMTSECADLYTGEDWDLMVEQKLEAANNRKEAAKRKERKDHDDERAGRGGRVQMSFDQIPGTRQVPDSDLPHGVKVRRSKSLKAAAERHQKRRKTGVVVHHKNSQWRTMTTEQILCHRKELDVLARAGLLDAFSDELEGCQEVDQVDFLYRFGRPPRVSRDTLEVLGR